MNEKNKNYKKICFGLLIISLFLLGFSLLTFKLNLDKDEIILNQQKFINLLCERDWSKTDLINQASSIIEKQNNVTLTRISYTCPSVIG